MQALPAPEQLAYAIKKRVALRPKLAIVLGTGLSQLIGEMEVEIKIPYRELDGFPLSTVEEHPGFLILGTLAHIPVAVMQGRTHLYEGYTVPQIIYPVRVLHALGVDTLFISNIAGGLRSDMRLGHLMVIEDHINLQAWQEIDLIQSSELSVRRNKNCYNAGLIQSALAAGKKEGYSISSGVYASVQGPQLETPAEYKYLQKVGAHAVGMSTVPEAIAAKQLGMTCFALSAITDLCFEPFLKPVDIGEIIETAHQAQPKMTFLFKHLAQSLPTKTAESAHEN